MTTIMLATDGSPTAELATKQAVEIAKALDASLVVATVWEITYEPVGIGWAPAIPDVSTYGRDQAMNVAERTAAEVRNEGIEVTTVVRRGIPAQVLCEIADENDADLIVMGSHGWGAFRRILFGSVSTAVLHHARQPVLVVPKSAETEAQTALAREKAEV